jgi:hypothetical protein
MIIYAHYGLCCAGTQMYSLRYITTTDVLGSRQHYAYTGRVYQYLW